MSPVTRIPMTREGYDKLKKEIDRLKGVERPRIIREVEVARAHGDLSENAEYHAAKEKLAYVNASLHDLEMKLSQAEIIDPKLIRDKEKVAFGATVTLKSLEDDTKKNYQLVGEVESDAANGRVSITSPLGRALIGKRVDDMITVRAPKGDTEYELVKIEYR